MKIAITGKGGVGKTTFTALLSAAWVKDKLRVIAIDADPSVNLGMALGFPNPEKIIQISEMAGLVEERTGATPGLMGQIFKINPKVDDLPDKIAYEHNGIKLIVMGGIKIAGSGCACPGSALIKGLIRHLLLECDEILIMDMEAGIEHLGRATASAVDVMLVVVEPSIKSISVADRIKKLSGQIGIKNIYAVGNKIQTEKDKEFIRDNLKGMEVIGFLPYSSDIIRSDKLNELVVSDDKIAEEINRIKLLLEKNAKNQA